ncbi:superoxide dismutase [Sphingomonas sp. SUN039]|uniref:superoxide dismutase n=1 Tax=Sphingomonas sp. SUN039 TaxID=2937787 RepID=UPI002164CFFF|nr:superoxide dismutase [Sphingomonas sp. SUN039]UVO53828.1 superoxide dismutase [Sphingomonas sp. SUN039]
MPFVLPPLPYARDALAPHMSGETLDFHHGKHHKAYVDKTNEIVAAKGLGGMSLVELIKNHTAPGDKQLFNQAAQLWNHSFFWQCLSPKKQVPSGKLADLIVRDFGSTEALLKKIAAEGVAHFGSGWAWLVLDSGKLKVASYHDADTPIAHNVAPLFTLDVWEHAYYIDYRNARPKFAETVLANIVNWDFVAQNLDGKGAGRADQKG